MRESISEDTVREGEESEKHGEKRSEKKLDQLFTT